MKHKNPQGDITFEYQFFEKFKESISVFCKREKNKEQYEIIRNICESYHVSVKKSSTIKIPFLKKDNIVSLESISELVPFTCATQFDSTGIFYGVDVRTNHPIIIDKHKSHSPNSFIFGETGCGKTQIIKNEIESVLLTTDEHIVVIDIYGEYSDLAHKYNGNIIKITEDLNIINNLFCLNLDYTGSKIGYLIENRIDFITDLFQLVSHKRYNSEEKSVLCKCLYELYNKYFKDNKKEITINDYEISKTITVDELYSILFKQSEPIAKEFADCIDLLKKKHPGLFLNKTAADSNKRFVVYNLSGLDQKTKTLAAYLCLHEYWNTMMKNSSRQIYTRLYLDNMILITSDSNVGSFLLYICRSCRKRYGMVTMSGFLSDVIDSPLNHMILSNCGNLLFLRHSECDAEKIAELINISERNVNHVINAHKNEGIICTSKHVLPIKLVYAKEK